MKKINEINLLIGTDPIQSEISNTAFSNPFLTIKQYHWTPVLEIDNQSITELLNSSFQRLEVPEKIYTFCQDEKIKKN